MNNIVSTTLSPPRDLSEQIPIDQLSKPKVPDFDKWEDLIRRLPSLDLSAIQSSLNFNGVNNIPAYLKKIWESNHIVYSLPNLGTTFHGLSLYGSVYQRLVEGANLWGRSLVQDPNQPETHWLTQVSRNWDVVTYPNPPLPFGYSERVWLVHSMSAGNQEMLPYLVDIYEDSKELEEPKVNLVPVEGTYLSLETPEGTMTIILRSVCLQLTEEAFDRLAPILEIHNLMHPAQIIR